MSGTPMEPNEVSSSEEAFKFSSAIAQGQRSPVAESPLSIQASPPAHGSDALDQSSPPATPGKPHAVYLAAIDAIAAERADQRPDEISAGQSLPSSSGYSGRSPFRRSSVPIPVPPGRRPSSSERLHQYPYPLNTVRDYESGAFFPASLRMRFGDTNDPLPARTGIEHDGIGDGYSHSNRSSSLSSASGDRHDGGDLDDDSDTSDGDDNGDHQTASDAQYHSHHGTDSHHQRHGVEGEGEGERETGAHGALTDG
ncbi:MAG: hypothetical protein M1837_002146 [Sclerophora amabilis]|nr:MAG: hypothetical protein M1837_002146 [Sclerophora amabilis]